MITIFYSHLLLCNHFLWPRWAKLYCQNGWGPCPDKPPPGSATGVTGQNGTGQNGTDKMVRTKWYTDKMVWDKMVRTNGSGIDYNSSEFNSYLVTKGHN